MKQHCGVLALLAALALPVHALPLKWEWLPGQEPKAATPKTLARALPRATSDRPDDSAGNQLHLMYVVALDGADEALDTNGRIGTSVLAFNRWLFAQSPGRAFRIDTFGGVPDVTFHRLSRTDAQLRATGAYVRNEIENELRAAGMIRNDKLYAVYYGGSSNYSCGGGAYPPTLIGNAGVIYLKGEPPGSSPCPGNTIGSGIETPGYIEFAMLHELMHTLGFVASCAPHHHLAGHVSDSANDLMWSGDAPWQLPPRLDIGRDDYYQHANGGCLDLDDSPYLVKASFQGLWLSPFADESGWGLNLTHQGEILFGTWFTYDTDGSAMWLVMSNGARTGDSRYEGKLYRTTGPGFDSAPFTSITDSNYTEVGSLRLTFNDADSGTMTYTVNGITQTTQIARYTYAAPAPACTFGAPSGSTPNYQDLWLNAPLGSESGWGVNITHQGDTLFATWFTYAAGGTAANPAKGMWLVMSNGDRVSPGVYSGALQRTSGPPFSSMPFNGQAVQRTTVGDATFTFTDVNSATFRYTVDGVTQTKPITRYIYSSPVTTCR